MKTLLKRLLFVVNIMIFFKLAAVTPKCEMISPKTLVSTSFRYVVCVLCFAFLSNDFSFIFCLFSYILPWIYYYYYYY